jgi:hypothetical protein
MRAVDSDYIVQKDEVLFVDYATDLQLKDAFTGYEKGPLLTNEQKIAQLDAEYQPKFAALAQALGLATLDGNQSVMDSIKSDYAALKAEYQTKKEDIENG